MILMKFWLDMLYRFNQQRIFLISVSPVSVKNRQGGFSLIDTLVAMLLFTITVQSVLNYQQGLLYRFSYYSESQQAWRLANHILDIYPASWPEPLVDWQVEISPLASMGECSLLQAEVKTPKGIKSVLQRWYCR